MAGAGRRQKRREATNEGGVVARGREGTKEGMEARGRGGGKRRMESVREKTLEGEGE